MTHLPASYPRFKTNKATRSFSCGKKIALFLLFPVRRHGPSVGVFLPLRAHFESPSGNSSPGLITFWYCNHGLLLCNITRMSGPTGGSAKSLFPLGSMARRKGCPHDYSSGVESDRIRMP